MKKLLLVSLILGLVGCGEDECISMAKKTVAAQLKDPSSAQFRNVNLHEHGIYVCGEINGKNSFGAYTGFVPFHYYCEKSIDDSMRYNISTGKIDRFSVGDLTAKMICK